MSKKLIISISAIVAVLLAAVIAVVAVFAANQQAVNTGFSVKYSATNVAATVSATYQRKTDDSATNLVTSDSKTSISFTAAEETTTKSLSTADGADIALSATNNYVIFTYTFKNDITAGGKSMSVKLNDTSVQSNVNVYYLASAETADYATIKGAEGSENTALPAVQTVAAQGTVNFYILVEIANDTLEAEYTSETTGETVKGISWELNSVVA